MTIKSDKWIRRMAAKGMIEPFEAGQVKEAFDAGYTYVGGEYAYRILKGEGTPASPEESFKVAAALPAIEPEALSRLARAWLGADGVTRDPAKAVALLERFVDAKNAEHARLLEEAKKS